MSIVAKLRNPGLGPVTPEDEAIFWRDLYADTLLEQKEKAFADQKKEATATARKANDSDTRTIEDRQRERNEALTKVNEDKKAYADFSRAVKQAIHENFQIILEIDHHKYKDDTSVNTLGKRFLEAYEDILREYAIQIAKGKTPKELLEAFNETRQFHRTFNSVVENATKERDEAIKKIKDDRGLSPYRWFIARQSIANANNQFANNIAKAKKNHKAILTSSDPDELKKTTCTAFNAVKGITCTDETYEKKLLKLKQQAYIQSNEALKKEMEDDKANAERKIPSKIFTLFLLNISFTYRPLTEYISLLYDKFLYWNRLRTNYYKPINTNDDAILEELEKEQKEKLTVMGHHWWAIFVGLNNAKYFALSCGTTMGGALLMIMSDYGSVAFGIAVAGAPFIVYIVTRANYWLTNVALPELALEMADPAEYIKNFFKKLWHAPATTIYNVLVSFAVTVVWAGLTYATTLELTKQLYEKSTMSEGLSATLGFGAMLTASLITLGMNLAKKKKMTGLKILSQIALFVMAIGLGYWSFGADAEMFQKVTVLFATITMTFYTAPAIYTVFNLYTDKFIKAFFKGAIDENGEDNEFHLKNISKSLDKIIEDAKANNGAGVPKFNKIYNIIMAFGVLLALCVTVMIQQALFGENFSFTQLPDYERKAFWTSFAEAGSIVGGVILATNLVINQLAPSDLKTNGINKAMLFKAMAVLGGAALIGTYAQVYASEHIMGIVFTKWFGVTDAQANVLNMVFTMGFGFLGGAAFYFGSAIRTTKQLFKTTDVDESHLSDPTGRLKKPDLSGIVYENKEWYQKLWYRLSDSFNWFGKDPTKLETKMTIFGNAVGNSIPTAINANTAAALGAFTGSSFVGSAGANIGMNSTVPMRYPKYNQQEGVVKGLRFMRDKEPKTQNDSSASNRLNVT